MIKFIPAVMIFVAIGCFCLPAWSVQQQGPQVAESAQFDTGGEQIGELRLGLAEKEVNRIIPCRPGKGKEILEGATGDYIQMWKYPECGILLKMVSERKGGAKSVGSVTVTSPCDLATGRVIRIGSAESEVVKAYGGYRDPENTKKGRTFVAGSIYDGMIFSFKGGKVVKIFLGAAAE